MQTTDPGSIISFYCDPSILVVTDDKPGNEKDNPSKRVTVNPIAGIRSYGDGIAMCAGPLPSSPGVRTRVFTTSGSGRSYIMFCPWYLEKMGKMKVPRLKKLLTLLKNPKYILNQGLAKFIPSRRPPPAPPEPAIDTLASIEKTILHELTHTRYAGRSDDIDGVESYRWANIRRLSTRDDAYNNADSLAYFGLCASLIREGWKITEDGDARRPIL
ncbi:hypothetical protein F4779DRAFT_596372 [Xylariaceae sp. FL0662B]|nr:hypothetical protein F4779DRAFT_596372 [Xylariaceae sp. FL0662B]